MKIKFNKQSLNIDGQRCPVHYSGGPWRTLAPGTITVYLHGWIKISEDTKKELGFQDDSDAMTDYFEYSKLRISPNSKYYTEVKSAAIKQGAICEEEEQA